MLHSYQARFVGIYIGIRLKRRNTFEYKIKSDRIDGVIYVSFSLNLCDYLEEKLLEEFIERPAHL